MILCVLLSALLFQIFPQIFRRLAALAVLLMGVMPCNTLFKRRALRHFVCFVPCGVDAGGHGKRLDTAALSYSMCCPFSPCATFSRFSLFFCSRGPILNILRTGLPFLPSFMHAPRRTSCLVEGCTAQTYGKSYCRAHNKNRVKTVVISDEQRAHMRSDCCDAHCIDGTRHEYGKQYCTKCKGACLWHPHALAKTV